ncbi:unnamed protein product [Rhizoctonia solani]|uniref:Uncharacterized protein n=1 Tax=Rhizoctonia solani TaxID=456999 RepID=A0A8H3DX09_9AGAM|nr:unnamed protein product [Rhizoctonia solani]
MAEDLDVESISNHDEPFLGHPAHPPSQEETIRDGTTPPADDPIRIMDTRCNPCKDRGQRSKCDRTWPSCSKCIREGTEDGCYGATDARQHQIDQHDPAGPPRAISAAPPPPPALIVPPPPLRRAVSAAPILQQVGAHPPYHAGPHPDLGPHNGELARTPSRGPRRSRSPPRAPPSVREVSRVRTPPTRSPNLDVESDAAHIYAQAAQLRETLAVLEARAKEIENQAIHSQLSDPSFAAVTTMAAPQVAAPIFAGFGIEGRRAPTIIPGHIGGATFAIVPDSVRRLFTGPNGCNTHVSLGYFTDEFREDISKHTSLTDSMVFNPRTNRFEAAPSELPDLDERSMQPPRFLRAWQNYLGFMNSINHPHLRYWQAHYNLITSQRDFFDNFPKWREYCIAVRRRTLQEGIDPSFIQKDILGPIDVEYERNKTLTAVRQMFDRSPRPHEPSSSLPTPGPSRHPYASTTSSSRHHDQARASTSARPDPPSGPPKCFFCGCKSHPSTLCKASVMVNGKPLLAKLSESGVMQINDSISAPCAVSLPTMPSAAPLDPRRVITPLIPDQWEHAIREAGIWDKFLDVPLGLRIGFRLGTSSSLTSTVVHKNHLSATKNPSVIDNHIVSELAAGRYSGPFARNELESRIGAFRASPLGVVDKPSAPGSFRVIQDFSFPIQDGTGIGSVNSEIDPTQFTCLWGFFSDVVEIILSLPPGSQAATFDVDAAYRRMPVHPDDQPHIIVHWNNSFYVDHCVPFGATSSNGIFGRCGDCILHIFQFRGFKHVVKWVDDFCFFRSPVPLGSGWAFVIDEAMVYAIADILGWPWKESKTRPFHTIFLYLGFEWDLERQSVCIPAAKKAKFLAKVNAWLASPKSSLKNTESLLGSLVHCALAIPSGRSRLVGLSRFSSSFSRDYPHRFATRSRTTRASEDVLWWKDQLSQHWCGSFIQPPPPLSPLEFYMDASTSFGIGVVCNQKFGIWKLEKGWFGSGRDIGWAEMIAVEIALDLLISAGLSNISIRFWSDNQGIIGALAAGRSRNDQQNTVLRRINEKQIVHNICLKVAYVNTEENLADGPSRGTPIPDGTPFSGPITLDKALKAFILPTQISNLEKAISGLSGTSTACTSRSPNTLLPTIESSTDPLLHGAINILPNAFAKSTLNGYSSTIQRFLTFCSDQNIPAARIFPSDEVVLCAFAASFAHRASGGSLANTMAALKAWHALHNMPWNGGPRLSYLTKGVANCAPLAATRPIRPGVTIAHLRDLHEALDLSNAKDAAIYAIACVAFWGMCRLGELLGSSRLKHDPSKLPSRSSLKGMPLVGQPLDLHLPCTKTSQREGATIRLLPQNGRTDPIYAVSNHLYVNSSNQTSDHLFAYRSDALGPPRCITKEQFLTRCNEIWTAKGKARLSGHNFRIGGANHLIDREVPSDIVKSMGRWKSGAYYKYWRKPEDKAVRFAQRLPDQPRAPDPYTRVKQGRLPSPAHAA